MKILFFSLLLIIGSFTYAELDFKQAWVRAVPPQSEVSAGFGVLTNTSNRERKLIRVESDISRVVELHTHHKKNGVMKMRPVDFIKVRAGEQKVLKPFSFHIMFIALKKPLVIGEQVKLVLIYDNGQSVTKFVPIKKR